MLPEGIWIGLGGNQAGSETALRQAITRLATLLPLQAVSSLYVTAPQDYLDQPDFLNAVAAFGFPDKGVDQPSVLLEILLDMELDLGRNRHRPIAKGPRLIDLDLLLWGSAICNSPSLTLPHPAMHLRRFVLDPLLEIEPGLTDPRTGAPYSLSQAACQDQAIYSKRSLGYTDWSV